MQTLQLLYTFVLNDLPADKTEYGQIKKKNLHCKSLANCTSHVLMSSFQVNASENVQMPLVSAASIHLSAKNLSVLHMTTNPACI